MSLIYDPIVNAFFPEDLYAEIDINIMKMLKENKYEPIKGRGMRSDKHATEVWNRIQNHPFQ